MAKGGTMKNKLEFLKRNRVNITSIFILIFALYYYFAGNINDALGYILLGIVLNLLNLAHSYLKPKENDGANKQK